MQIHSDTLTFADLWRAARIARVDMVKCDRSGSRSRDHKYNVNLEGESRRAPNQRGMSYGAKAATWDQWGVFLAVLFDIDPNMVCGPSEKNAYYNGRDDFHHKTADRFRSIGGGWDEVTTGEGYWPADAHGDHTFKFNGVARVQQCTKCSAVDLRWAV